MLISAFSALIGMGGSPRASIRMGEGHREGAEEILGNCFVSLLGISVGFNRCVSGYTGASFNDVRSQ